MFSTRITRAAHHGATSTAAAISTSATSTAQYLAARRSPAHQRRPSSSKAQSPPDSSKPAPTAKATTTATGEAGPTTAAEATPPVHKRPTRPYKRTHLSRTDRVPKHKEPTVDQFAGLPAVPGTQHLHERDISLSSFFSLHRPLSLSAPVPPTSSQEAFDSIFASKEVERDPWVNGNSAERRPEDVIYTLHNTIETLESNSASPADSEGVRWEIIQESPSNNGSSIKHLDGAPRLKSLDEIVAQFRPFRVPPPPQPFAAEPKSGNAEKKRLAKQVKQNQLQPKQESYTTTIIVTASTFADGQRTFRASSSPIVRIPNPEQQGDQVAELPVIQEPTRHKIKQPFLERMKRRQQLHLQNQHNKTLERMGDRTSGYVRRAPSAKRIKLLCISVKRQRKLKMKKHKYKKLMKRTRNLRRKLDRI